MARKPATIGREAVTKQERVYGILRQRIQTGEYGPGYRIVIDRLAAEFGVSALPVREAVRRVQAEGLVVFRRNSGACVTPAEPELADSIIELLAVVEGYATALAAPHLDGAGVVGLRALTDAMEEAIARRDSGDLARLDCEFHALLEDHCPNSSLVGLLHDVTRRLNVVGRATPFCHSGREAETVAGYRALVDLLDGSDSPSGIEQAARMRTLRHERARLANHIRVRERSESVQPLDGESLPHG